MSDASRPILFTFLGAGRYEEAIYEVDAAGEPFEHRTRFAPVATASFLRPQEVRLFLTEGAKGQHGEAIERELQALSIAVRPIPIPDGRGLAEWWGIFEAIVREARATEGVPLAFDITHGFRHFPILGLLAAAFLQSAYRVALGGIFYGAYEMRRAGGEGEPPRVPLLDLTPMLELLQWAVAADRFRRQGDARDLAELLKRLKGEIGRQGEREAAGHLNHLINGLEGLSLALLLIRPLEGMTSAAWLGGRMDEAGGSLRNAAERWPGLRPLLAIWDQAQAFREFALEDPLKRPEEFLRTGLRLARWYVEHDLGVQAVTWAREWLVTYAMVQKEFSGPGLVRRDEREGVERNLNSEARQYREAEDRGSYRSRWFREVPEDRWRQFLELWLQAADLRNDLDHAGMREEPRKASDLQGEIRKLVEKLEAFYGAK
ncbi:MAG: TIGR02221 family CRISPR-associated protein [Thermoflexus sp.]|uniref:TIGR02221 family CRISPR-associated protein n=1 Tax=Thermoflexus sp. TaxID=1969742 RepID=UPI0025D7136C|nr:TIGR02221 family CRISPR-associated protein [Thermoflexus sp.]MCS6962927.1 TIGR02221 family CRISPR-associated protein [Thermoflexus sp.]MDW8185862.1 TIGR02221 family CRISPR-associated protein [Anaerolineae bacterium]